MQKRYDRPDHPELGHVYPGDYEQGVPFEEYIRADQPLPEGRPVFDIRDWGARPEEGLLNTEAFQAAADACGAAGGGVLLVTGGTYRMGTVWLRSGTTLFITPDAAIEASRSADLLTGADPNVRKDGESSGGAFLRAKGCRDIALTGGGRVLGSGEWFVHEPREMPMLTPYDTVRIPRRDQKDVINTVPGTVRYYVRQRIRYAEDKYGEGKPLLRRPSSMVWLEDCEDVRVENVILQDAMCWTLHLEQCDRVLVRDMVIHNNRHVANTDGIDVNASSHVEIAHCFISTADDALCLKTLMHTTRPTAFVHIHDCVVSSVANAFKIGTETRRDVHHVLVENCLFRMPDIWPGVTGGISVESCDGARVEDVTVRNVKMDRVVAPVYMLLNMRNRGGDPYTPEVGENAYWGGAVRRIRIENVEAADAELPCILSGFETVRPDGTPVRRALEDITIRGLTVVYREAGETVELPESYDELLTDYPESNAHGDVDACGLWIRHADGVTLEDIRVTPRTCNTRETVTLRDVTRVRAREAGCREEAR